MSETITLPLHDVSIDRGNTVITTQVPEHEIEVLRAVHGVAEVQDAGQSDDEIELNASADGDWGRLQRKYKRQNAADPLPIAFRTGPSQLKQYGFSMERGAAKAAPQAGIRNHKKPSNKPKRGRPASSGD